MSSPLEGVAEALVVRPGDTLIVRTSGGDYDEQQHLAALREDFDKYLPGVKVVVVSGDLVAQIGVARSDEGGER